MHDAGAYDASYFDEISTKAVDAFEPYAALLARLGVSAGQSSLDLGCATGAVFLSALHAPDFYGVDVSEHAISECRRRFPAATGRLKRADLNMSAPDFGVPFDFVTAFDVIEHLDNLGEVKRLFSTSLRPGGHVLITTPNAQSVLRLLRRPYTGDMDPTHVNLFTPYTLDFWLRRIGLVKRALLTPWSFRPRVDGPSARIGLGGQIVAVYRRPLTEDRRA